MQGAALWARLSASHGYLNKQGYCDGSNTLGSPSGNCHQFPVIWGETGTGFIDSIDQQPMTDMIPYWQNTGAAADGLHNRLSGMFWWAWNSNAGQSLGLVENWSQMDWNKMAYLQTVGYTPWWITPTPTSSELSGPSSPSPSASPAAAPHTAASPSGQAASPSYPGASPAASPSPESAASPAYSSYLAAASTSPEQGASPSYSGTSPAASPSPEPAASPSYSSPSLSAATSSSSGASPAASPSPEPAASPAYSGASPSASPYYSGASPAASPSPEPAASPQLAAASPSYSGASPAASPEPAAASPSPQPTQTPSPTPSPAAYPPPPPYYPPPPPPPTPTLPTTAAAAAPAQLLSPPPPPITFASNTNSNSGGSSSSDSSFSSTSTIGDVFTYEPKGGGSIESAGPVGPTTSALTAEHGIIVGTDGLPVPLKGVIWSGFENGTMVSGLQGRSSATADFSTQVTRLRALGFNAVKLPFSFAPLLGAALAPVSTACTTSTDDQVQASVLPAGTSISATAAVPALLAESSNGPNQCNMGLPTTSALDRYSYIVNFLTSNGLYAVLENSFADDRSAIANPQGWIQNWVRLISTISANSVAASRIIISPLGNPDAQGLQWQAANGLPGLSNIYLAAMDALNQLNPQALFFLQGAGQTALTGSPGDGFVTDTATLQKYNFSDPSPFFKTLLVRPYVNQVVVTPLYQAPSVINAGLASSTGAALWQHLTSSFGYLNKEGFCPSSTTCKTFAVAVGGFGSGMTSGVDAAAFSDLAAYLQPLCGLPACLATDGAHAPIYSWFWDGWSPDSEGAIQSADGTGMIGGVLDYLVGLGLSPWYLPPSAQRAKPQALTPEQLPPTVQADANFCQADMMVTSAGTDNTTGLFLGSVMVIVTNVGNVAVPTPWTITIANPYYLGVSQAYGLSQPQYTIGGTLSGTAGDYWDVLWPHSTNSVSVGFLILSRDPAQLQPSTVLLNGNKCVVGEGAQSPSSGIQATAAAPAAGVQAATPAASTPNH